MTEAAVMQVLLWYYSETETKLEIYTTEPFLILLFPDPELLDLQLNDSNAVLRVLREMVDVRLLVNPRFLLIWDAFFC